MIGFAALALLLAAPDALTDPAPKITVVGSGGVETPPDLATLSIEIRGEGKTADQAAADLQHKQTAIFAGIASLSSGSVAVENGDVSLRVQRAGKCDSDDEDSSVLSTGPCAITGYVVASSATVRMSSVNDAATAVGLAGRLGAVKASIDSFSLKSEGDARDRAIAAAFLNARMQAGAIATASGMRLGAVVTVEDSPLLIAGNRLSDGLPALSSRFSGPPPVKIGVTPAPVRTTSRMTVTFALEK